MRCPKCEGTLETRTYGKKIAVKSCSECKGLFCKPDTLIEMRREWMSELVLDSGDPKLGRKYNEVEEIDCPECGIPMEKTSDPSQRHIWFERCGRCEGMFFDAGEFTDLKYETFMDRIRYFTRGSRPASS